VVVIIQHYFVLRVTCYWNVEQFVNLRSSRISYLHVMSRCYYCLNLTDGPDICSFLSYAKLPIDEFL